MRVAIVCPYDLHAPGGVQVHVANLSRQLRAGGDQVLVVGPGDPADPVDGAMLVGGSVRVRFNDSVAPITLSPMAARRALRAIQRFRPDVVHVHEPAVPAVSLIASLRAPQPIVGTFHAWSARSRAYRLARPLARRAVERLGARLAVSRPTISYHASALGLPAGSFRELPNGVDVAHFAGGSPLPELTGTGAPTLLFVGRFDPRKGLEQLARAFVVVKSRRPTLRLLVAGDGPEEERAKAVLPASVRRDVTFLGRIAQEDLPRIYASADLFVAPALGGESFGIVLLEAMAAGLPVVATSIDGYRSVVHDGVDGRLVPPGDVQALADAIDVLLDNPALREALAREGRQAVEAYDWPEVTARVREVYEQVIAEATDGP